MNELPKAYHNSRNGEIRVLVPWRWQCSNLRFLAPNHQNRLRSRLRKMNAMRALAQSYSNCKNFPITIVEQDMNSRGSWRFRHWHIKTDLPQGVWKMNQEEFSNLVENWWSLDQKCDEDFWENLQFLEGKLVKFLRIVIMICNSVTIRTLYFSLIILLITN